MTIQFNFSNTKPTQIELHSKELEDKRLEIKAAGFELLELWHTDGVHTHEVWKNPKTLETLSFQIVPEPKEPIDASRQEVVDELIDLWIELRAIRNNFDTYFDDDVSALPKNISLKDHFDTKVEQFKNEKELDPEAWAFLFNSSLDESILAYYDLSIDDRKAICH